VSESELVLGMMPVLPRDGMFALAYIIDLRIGLEKRVELQERAYAKL
jgi:hypothetical protein